MTKPTLVLTPLLLSISFCSTRANYLPIYGGPGARFASTYLPYSPGTTAGDGTGVGSVLTTPQGNYTITAYRWDSSGIVELESLTGARPYAINSHGTAVGSAGNHASRWEADGVAVTQLGDLGTTASGGTTGIANAINNAGTSAGAVYQPLINQSYGYHAVRWDAGQTAATALNHLGTDANGYTESFANSINASGMIVGQSVKYVDAVSRGTRAVRWAANGTAITELGTLGTDTSGNTESVAYKVNNAGIAVGYARQFDSAGHFVRRAAARWDASGTAATALIDADGTKSCYAWDINSAGITIGATEAYVNTFLVHRAVRWDAGQNIAVELDDFGDANAEGSAYAINDQGIIVGSLSGGGGGAVVWLADGTAVGLNSLIDPALGWSLHRGIGISETNWVTGYGSFDPDGPGGQAAYDRLFLMQVPEPAAPAFLGAILMSWVRGRRRRRYV